MPLDLPPPSVPERVVMTADDIDRHVDGPLAGILRETFAAEARAHHRGWDDLPPVVLQYLDDPGAPSGVAVVPIVAARLGDPVQVAELLAKLVAGVDDPGGAELRARIVDADTQGYLGCAMAFEGYIYPGPEAERRRRWGDLPLAEIADSIEVRSIRGVTADGRMFEVARMRDAGPPMAVVDIPRGVDPTRTSTALQMAIDRLSKALADAYRCR